MGGARFVFQKDEGWTVVYYYCIVLSLKKKPVSRTVAVGEYFISPIAGEEIVSRENREGNKKVAILTTCPMGMCRDRGQERYTWTVDYYYQSQGGIVSRRKKREGNKKVAILTTCPMGMCRDRGQERHTWTVDYYYSTSRSNGGGNISSLPMSMWDKRDMHHPYSFTQTCHAVVPQKEPKRRQTKKKKKARKGWLMPRHTGENYLQTINERT